MGWYVQIQNDKQNFTNSFSKCLVARLWWFLFICMHYPRIPAPTFYTSKANSWQISIKCNKMFYKNKAKNPMILNWALSSPWVRAIVILSLQIKFRISFRLFQNLKTLKISILWWFKWYYLAMAYNLHIIRAKAKSSALFNRLNQKGFWYIVIIFLKY